MLLTYSAIAVPHQYLMTKTPTPIEQYNHHVSLLSSHSTEKKRDSLAYLTTCHTTRPVNDPLPVPVSLLLPELYPLILNGSNSVRAQLILLLRTLSPNDLEPYIEKLLLYIRTGITHIVLDVHSSASEMLQWAIESCPMEVVSWPGGWVKTLKTVLIALAWHNPPPPKTNGKQPGWSSLPPGLDPSKARKRRQFPSKIIKRPRLPPPRRPHPRSRPTRPIPKQMAIPSPSRRMSYDTPAVQSLPAPQPLWPATR